MRFLAAKFVVNAIALDAQYKPIPVLHSDGGFALLLQDPPAAELDQLVETMLRPFPAGLLTDAGLLVANPVFADATRQRQLGPTAYHGTVIWSWQQALLAAGLERQVARRDLPPATIKRLRTARQQLWSVIEQYARVACLRTVVLALRRWPISSCALRPKQR